MVEDGSNDAGLGDESEDLHRATASVTGQRVDLVDTADELGPALVGGASGRSRLVVVVVGTNRHSVVLSDAIGVRAVEMDQVLVGLWDVSEALAKNSSGSVKTSSTSSCPGLGW